MVGGVEVCVCVCVGGGGGCRMKWREENDPLLC